MDGASKFVKGDAMAGILITGINLIGGIVIGVVQLGMPFGEAAQHFSLLTVGDGLCAQIPALLISVATGILVTRSASEKDLGSDVAGQILEQRKAPLVAGVVIMCFALVPALPKLPFLVIGGAVLRRRLVAAQAAEQGRSARPQRPPQAAAGGRAGEPPPRATRRSTRSRSTRSSSRSASASCRSSTSSAGGTLLAARRHDPPPDRLRARHGHPARPHPRRRGPGLARVRHARARHGGRARRHHGRPPARDGPGRRDGPAPGIPTTEPAFGLPAVWIPRPARAEAEALGWTVVDPSRSSSPTSPRRSARTPPSCSPARRPASCSTSSRRSTPRSSTRSCRTCSRSARSSACCSRCCARASPIRDLGAIVEAIGDKARLTRDPAMLAEYARQALGRTIVAPYLDGESTLRAIALDPSLEQEIAEALVQTADGEFLAMDPARRTRSSTPAPSRSSTRSPRAAARCCCARRACAATCAALRAALPQLAVCSYNEIAPVSALRPSVCRIGERSRQASRCRYGHGRLVPME